VSLTEESQRPAANGRLASNAALRTCAATSGLIAFAVVFDAGTRMLKRAAAFDTTGGATTGERMAKRMGLDGERLRDLARLGAEVTLRRLRAEIVAIERAFRS